MGQRVSHHRRPARHDRLSRRGAGHRRRAALLAAAIAAGTLGMVGAASAHPERPTFFPDHSGSVPERRTDGPASVVCTDDSEKRIREDLTGRLRQWNLRLLRGCHHHGEIQPAIDAAGNGHRILVLPGVYTEPASRNMPVDDPACEEHYTYTTHGDARAGAPQKYRVAKYEYQLGCPNARNLIAIVGDSNDEDRRCDARCNLQLEGTGDDPGDVVIRGDRRKLDVVHVDRADGAYLANFTVEHGASNGVNVIETDGFAIRDVVARSNQNYGVLTFTADHGLYDGVTTYGNGHAGVYPGSAAERHHDPLGGGAEPPLGTGTTDCTGEHSIEMRDVDSHRNAYGYSGTGANALWVHDSRFHHNATGISTDSTASAHPGMPQDCARFERNFIYSNNLNVFAAEHEQDCEKPFHERDDPSIPCPYFPAPVGTGIQIAGGNDNTLTGNHIYDNWRSGVRLFWVPAPVRANPDPRKLFDTSNENRFTKNRLGARPAGSAAPNGLDFWWDEEGVGNCWSGNRGPRGREPTSDPPELQEKYPCPQGNPFAVGNQMKLAEQAPCLAYDPRTNRHPPGCSWITPPEQPG